MCWSSSVSMRAIVLTKLRARSAVGAFPTKISSGTLNVTTASSSLGT